MCLSNNREDLLDFLKKNINNEYVDVYKVLRKCHYLHPIYEAPIYPIEYTRGIIRADKITTEEWSWYLPKHDLLGFDYVRAYDVIEHGLHVCIDYPSALSYKEEMDAYVCLYRSVKSTIVIVKGRAKLKHILGVNYYKHLPMTYHLAAFIELDMMNMEEINAPY